MARRVALGLCFAGLCCAAILQGCDRSATDRGQLARIAEARVAPNASVGTRSGPPRERSTYSGPALPTAVSVQSQTGDTPPWLTELLNSPDPNVRVQALDAWARQPTASLDSVTYALVDPDESVRTRAQELVEEVLARR